MERKFKIGDKVFHIQYGWGVVTKLFDHEGDMIVQSKFTYGDKTISFAIRNNLQNLLSFTEYTLDGFSEERPEEIPNEGDIVWTRNEFPSEWEIGYFFKKEGNTYYTSASKNSQGWRSAGLEIRTTNPYEDEQ